MENSDLEDCDIEDDESDDAGEVVMFEGQNSGTGCIDEMIMEVENVSDGDHEDEEEMEILEDEGAENSPSYEREQQDNCDSDDDLPLSVYQKKIKRADFTEEDLLTKRKKKSEKSTFTWKKAEDFHGIEFAIPANEDTSQDRRNFTPGDYFSMYMDNSMFQTICDCTSIKYMLLRNKSLNLSLKETKYFFGISILMSLLKYPRIRMYWAKSTKVYSIASVMTRDRFFTIRNHIKVVVDGDISENFRKSDKLWKVRPLLNKIRETCLSLPRENVVAVDEQMIPFTGICGVKQFVRGKPNPEGLKNFVCATPSGLVLDFEIYQGKDTFLENTTKDLGVGPSAVVRLVRSLREGTQIFMDRYFTTIPLLEYLLDNKFHGTGTIMKSRIPRGVHLTSETILKRLGRGATEQSVRSDGKINVIQWYDLKPVLLASTNLQEHPVNECRRWSKQDKSFILVKRPNMVAKYNESMGGIDLVDRMIAYYRMNARTNKWTVKTILHFTDLAIANSWILYRNDQIKLGEKHMQFFDFKLKVSEWLLRSVDNEEPEEEARSNSIHTRNNPTGYVTPRPNSCPSAQLPCNNNASIRSRQHLPILRGELKNAVRCKYSGCKKKTKFMCEKCNAFYCITSSHNCFYEFHKK